MLSQQKSDTLFFDDTRGAYCEALMELAERNKNIVILEADVMKAAGTEPFKEKYPEYAKKYETEKENLPKAWQLKPITSRTLVGIEPEYIVYWRKAEPVVMPI